MALTMYLAANPYLQVGHCDVQHRLGCLIAPKTENDEIGSWRSGAASPLLAAEATTFRSGTSKPYKASAGPPLYLDFLSILFLLPH